MSQKKIRVRSITQVQRYMHRIAVCLVLGLLLMAGCYRKVCPTYASAFILDDSLRQLMFSPFRADSMPLPPPRIKKNQYYLIARMSDRKKHRSMRSIVAKKVYPTPLPKEETSIEVQDLGALQAETIRSTETTAPDTLNTIAEEDLYLGEEMDLTPQYLYGYDPNDNFNVEQEFYNRHFGHLLVAEEAEAAQEAAVVKESEIFEDIPDAYIEGSIVEEEEIEEELNEEDETEEEWLPEELPEEDEN